MNPLVVRALLPGAVYGLIAVALSLPGLFVAHRALGIGDPPLSGLLLLGGCVLLCFALAGAIGVAMGLARSNALLSALLGLVLGITACLIVVPLYGGMVVDGLTRDATMMLWDERAPLEKAARDRAGETWIATREGRLREQLADYQKQAVQATTPEARAAAARRAGEVALIIAEQGKVKGIALLKVGAARSSAFLLLFWVIVGPPVIAGLNCRRAKSRY